MSRKTIYCAIEAERNRQDRIHGSDNLEATPNDWIAFLAEEVGEAAQHMNNLTWTGFNVACADSAKEELIQVAALAVAAIEYLEAKEGR